MSRPPDPWTSFQFSRRALTVMYAIVGASWITGAAWIFLHYFLQRRGEFGMTPHPAETWSLKLHGATAIAALLLIGAIWSSHILPAWRSLRRPVSGLTLATAFILLITSGYLLNYLGDDRTRAAVAITHWVVGLVLPAVLIVHVLHRRGVTIQRR